AGAGVAGVGGGDAGPMPCEVQNVVQARCQNCHGAQLIGGAPMHLMTVADFQRDYTLQTTPGMQGQSMKVHQIANMRINRTHGVPPMPQGVGLQGTELAMLTNWLTSGAPAGSACVAVQPQGGAAGMQVNPPTGGMDVVIAGNGSAGMGTAGMEVTTGGVGG